MWDFLYIYFKKILTDATNRYIQWVVITGEFGQLMIKTLQMICRGWLMDRRHWLRRSLLWQLGLFVFGGRPLQTQSVHCEGDRTRHEWNKTDETSFMRRQTKTQSKQQHSQRVKWVHCFRYVLSDNSLAFDAFMSYRSGRSRQRPSLTYLNFCRWWHLLINQLQNGCKWVTAGS